jgi:fumarate reductase flavoprotein subunit
LASGSISGNRELCKRFFPDLNWGEEIGIAAELPTCQGDGMIMAENVGAKITNKFTTLFVGPLYFGEVVVVSVINRGEVLKINNLGERFVNEDLPNIHDWGWMEGAAVESQPNRQVWCLLDDGIAEEISLNKRRNFNYMDELYGMGYLSANAETLPPEEKGDLTAWMKPLREKLRQEPKDKVCVSDHLADIAEFMGCDLAALEKTIEEYNGFCEAKYDDDFLKREDFLLPFQKKPYYCVKAWQGIDSVSGGVVVDHDLRVIDKNYRPIPGLYSVGTCAGGWGIDRYGFWGANLSFVTYSGYACGELLAKELK